MQNTVKLLLNSYSPEGERKRERKGKFSVTLDTYCLN